MMMKYRTIILLITFTVLFSCKDDGEIIYNLKRTIKNQSGVEVMIISFFYSPDTVAQLTLANGEESTVSASFSIVRGGLPRSYTPHCLFETADYVDSVILVFNNSKFQVHCGFRDHGTKCIAYENDIMFIPPDKRIVPKGDFLKTDKKG